MIKKMTMAVVTMLIALLMVGVASAASNEIGIQPDTVGEPIPVPINQDAFDSIGLEIDWNNWGCTDAIKCNWKAEIIDDDTSENEWSDSGASSSDDWITEIHWTPGDDDLDHEFTLYAQAVKKKYLKAVEQPLEGIPELSTSILTAAGIIGMIGLVRLKRKN